LVGGVPHQATFVIDNGSVNGWANYSEATGLLCPAFGDATNINGNVTLTGGATGIIRRAEALPATAPGGSITSVTYSASFIYSRVGVNAVLQITGGYLSINYHIPATGSGTITQAIVVGEGSAVFQVNAQEAAARCVFPGALGYRLIGDASLVTASA
jgi:hypothetical protein